MIWEQAANGFAAMGSEARLLVLRCLVKAGAPGLSVSEIQDRTGIAPSTLAHHLKFLAGAGVIEQERIGRAVISRASFQRLEQLAAFILSECCSEEKRKAANDG
ncbi:MAG: metalloregulator ArsR/SmtB family transcription factor [Aestuariivita sp.]|uniref:ArsR/SmtB family transcription factor n=1 Tax=Aestuariivita sp. TaxID=1872407 RepID=UPI003BB1288C